MWSRARTFPITLHGLLTWAMGKERVSSWLLMSWETYRFRPWPFLAVWAWLSPHFSQSLHLGEGNTIPPKVSQGTLWLLRYSGRVGSWAAILLPSISLFSLSLLQHFLHLPLSLVKGPVLNTPPLIWNTWRLWTQSLRCLERPAGHHIAKLGQGPGDGVKASLWLRSERHLPQGPSSR